MKSKIKYPRFDIEGFRVGAIRKGLAIYGFTDSPKFGRRYSLGLFWPELGLAADLFIFKKKPLYKPLWLMTIIGVPFMVLIYLAKRLWFFLSEISRQIWAAIVIVLCIIIGLVKEMERNRELSQEYKWRYVQMEYVRLSHQKRVIDSVMMYSDPRDSAFYHRVAVEIFLKHNDQVKALKTELFQIPTKDSAEFNLFTANLSVKL